MKAWIVWGTIFASFLLGEVLLARAQAQAGRQVAGQAAGARQATAPAQPAPAAPSATSAPPQAPTPPSGSRRDPFRAIVIKKPPEATLLAPNCTQPGKKSLLVVQLQLQGIARNVEGQWIAVVDNKTKRAYFLYAGDELYNGTVTRITESSVVFAEKMTDQTGRPQSREVVKQLMR